jgi:imidazolonepropionase-like amidohydrolase
LLGGAGGRLLKTETLPQVASLSIPAAARDRRVWLRVGTLLDGTSTKPLHNAHIVYDSEQILYAGENAPSREALNPDQRAPDCDLAEFTLLPGLIDAHTHLFLEGGELDLDKRSAYLNQSPDELLCQAQARLEKIVRLGVIGLRDAGDKHGVGLALSRLNESPDRPIMPYVDSPGAAIHHHGRYGSFMAEPMRDCGTPRDCVAARVNAGADRIKLIATGIINFKKGAVTTEPQMTTAEIRELVAAAKEFGKQTLAHASGDDGIERVIEGGVDSVEHGFFIRDDQLAKMRDREIAWVPTFSPVQEQVDHADRMGWDAQVVENLQKILDQHAASLVKAHAMGVQVIAGSDAGSCGVAHGLGLLYELELMERAGLSPISVINSATGAGPQHLAFKEKFGQIKPGFRSRFLLTRHSPLESVTSLSKDMLTVFDGKTLGTRGDFNSEGL